MAGSSRLRRSTASGGKQRSTADQDSARRSARAAVEAAAAAGGAPHRAVIVGPFRRGQPAGAVQVEHLGGALGSRPAAPLAQAPDEDAAQARGDEVGLDAHIGEADHRVGGRVGATQNRQGSRNKVSKLSGHPFSLAGI